MAEKTSKKGLGSGLGALFDSETIISAQKDDTQTLPISKVEPRQEQPRTVFDEEKLAELASSLSEHGMIQPITVRKLDSGYYQIIAGERRWRAARLAGLTEVPVRVIDADDRKASELALVENLQRQDLNPIEEALGLKALIDDYGMTQEEAAQSIGKSRPAVTNALRLLALCPEVIEMVKEGLLSTGHARALLAIRDPSRQLAAAEKVIAMELSVRQTETLAARLAKEPQERPDTEVPGIKVDYAAEVEKALERRLGRKVRLVEGRRKGRIELEYYGVDDRERLIKTLSEITVFSNKKD